MDIIIASHFVARRRGVISSVYSQGQFVGEDVVWEEERIIFVVRHLCRLLLNSDINVALHREPEKISGSLFH